MPSYSPKIGDPISTLDTPSLIINLNTMEKNLTTLFALLSPTGIAIRPHLKTTKSPALAKLMIARGALGGCVAKISEAEVMVREGVTDLLITTEVVGGTKVRRLVELHGSVEEGRKDGQGKGGLKVVVDSKEEAMGLEHGIVGYGAPNLQVLIDVDVGTHRTGVKPGQQALDLAVYIRDRCPHLDIIGVQGYEGHLQHLHDRKEREEQCIESMRQLTTTADLLRENGFRIDVVTTGGTGTAEFCASYTGITEVQPGSFVFMDSDYSAAVSNSHFKQALTVRSTVISAPIDAQGEYERRVVVDAGLKALTTDSGFAVPWGLGEGVTYAPLGDEHGELRWEEGSVLEKGRLKVGDRVEIVPSHIDPTVNLYDTYYGVRDGVVEEIWAVAARGCVQ